MNLNDLRMSMKAALDNLWSRIQGIFSGLDDRVSALEQGGGGGEVNVIEAISFNGSNIPPDASKRVSMSESDPTVPSWAKQSSKPSYTAVEVGAIPASEKGSSNGVAELDSGGKVPSSQLPSYVDDVLEYATSSAFPATGETGKIYVATDTNLTYRWTGSGYVEIAGGLALGETSSTAYRGDRGKIAYDHAQARGSAYASGLYLIETNAEGHVIAAVPVTKANITALGIPEQDTTYDPATQTDAGLMSATDKAKLDNMPAEGIPGPQGPKGDTGPQGPAGDPATNLLTGVKGNAESAYRQGDVNLTPEDIGAVATTDIIDLAHGGTNATSESNAKINLAVHVQLNTASWSDVYTKLSKVTGGQSAFFWITTAEVAQFVSGTTTMAWESGIVTSTGSGNYTLVAFNGDGTRYTWRITGLTSTSGTVGPIKTMVTGIKGDAESTYRTGNVNLTPANIGAVASVTLYQHDADRDAIWTEITKIPVTGVAPIFITSNGCSILTGGKLSKYLYGIVSRTNNVNVMIVAGRVDAIYTWEIVGLNTDNYTVGAIRQYTGTVI